MKKTNFFVCGLFFLALTFSSVSLVSCGEKTMTVAGEKGDKGDTGETGAAGTSGVDGTDGTVWFTGNGAPIDTSLESPKVNDLYLDLASYDLYKKDDTGVWSKIGNIKGATGATGATGASGSNGSSGSSGSNGTRGSMWFSGTGELSLMETSHDGTTLLVHDYYINLNNSDIYEYTSDGWSKIGTLSVSGSSGATMTSGDNNPDVGDFSTGDWFYNTSEHAIYEATSDSEWTRVGYFSDINISKTSSWYLGDIEPTAEPGENELNPVYGKTIKSGSFYLNLTDLAIYYYDGTDWAKITNLFTSYTKKVTIGETSNCKVISEVDGQTNYIFTNNEIKKYRVVPTYDNSYVLKLNIKGERAANISTIDTETLSNYGISIYYPTSEEIAAYHANYEIYTIDTGLGEDDASYDFTIDFMCEKTFYWQYTNSQTLVGDSNNYIISQFENEPQCTFTDGYTFGYNDNENTIHQENFATGITSLFDVRYFSDDETTTKYGLAMVGNKVSLLKFNSSNSTWEVKTTGNNVLNENYDNTFTRVVYDTYFDRLSGTYYVLTNYELLSINLNEALLTDTAYFTSNTSIVTAGTKTNLGGKICAIDKGIYCFYYYKTTFAGSDNEICKVTFYDFISKKEHLYDNVQSNILGSNYLNSLFVFNNNLYMFKDKYFYLLKGSINKGICLGELPSFISSGEKIFIDSVEDNGVLFFIVKCGLNYWVVQTEDFNTFTVHTSLGNNCYYLKINLFGGSLTSELNIISISFIYITTENEQVTRTFYTGAIKYYSNAYI